MHAANNFMQKRIKMKMQCRFFLKSPYLFLVFLCEKETLMNAIRNKLLQTPDELPTKLFFFNLHVK